MTDTHSIVLYMMGYNMFYLIHPLFCRVVKQDNNIYFYIC